MPGRKPDVEVYLVSKQLGGDGKRKYAQIGAGWRVFEDGTLNLKLNPGTFLDWRMDQDYYITVKPYSNKTYKKDPNSQHNTPPDVRPEIDDDIPF